MTTRKEAAMRAKGRIMASLSVGVAVALWGQSAPSQNLVVKGQISATGATCPSGGCVHSFGGSVGIGTSAPRAKLDVTGGVLAVGTMAGVPPLTADGVIASFGPWADFSFFKRELTAWPQTFAAGDGFAWYDSNGVARLWTWVTGDLFSITGAGNVGIGTDGPAAKLDVAGTVHSSGAGTDSWYPYIDGNTYVRIPPGGFATFDGLPSYSTVMRVNNNGTVGIGTPSPNYPLDVAGTIHSSDALAGSAGPNGIGGQLVARSGNRFSVDWDGSNLQFYVDVTNVKTFVIDHPTDPDRYLVHSAIEGPEWGAVYYRGTAKLHHGVARVVLPAYFEALTKKEHRTVLLTCKNRWSPLYYENIKDGILTVRVQRAASPALAALSPSLPSDVEQEFDWEVKAERKGGTLAVEPRRSEIAVFGEGPYKYYRAIK
jgi:hypothetical protein